MEDRRWNIWCAVGIVCAVAGLLLGIASIALRGGTPASVAAVVIASFAIAISILAILSRQTGRRNPRNTR